MNLVMMLPLIVPGVVSALGYYSFLGRAHLVGTHFGMIVAHSVLSIPVAFLVISASLKGFDRNLERAAMSAGAGPLRTFMWVTLAGAAARHSGRRAVRLPALVQRGRGRDLHRRPRRRLPCQRRCSNRSASNPIPSSPWYRRCSPARCCSACSSPCSSVKGPHMRIDPLVKPRSVAIVGASDRGGPGTPIIESLGAIGFTGPIYPVNPNYPSVLNLTCYPTLTDLPEAPDMVVFSIRNPLIPEQMRLAVQARRARRRDLRQRLCRTGRRRRADCRNRSPAWRARPAWRCAGRTAWASSIRRRA